MHITDREGRPFLNGEQFPEETLRILGVVIELAKTGERNPDLLCERALKDIRQPIGAAR